MDEKQLQLLWEAHAKSGGFKDYNEFKSLMLSPSSRKVYFDDANTQLGFKDYGEFETILQVKKKEQSTPSIVSSIGAKIGGEAGTSVPQSVEQKTPQQKLNNLGVNVTFEKKNPLAPNTDNTSPIYKRFDEPTYIDVENPESLSTLSTMVTEAKKKADPYKYAAFAEPSLGLKNKEFAKKTAEADELMGAVSQQAVKNTFQKVVSTTPVENIDRSTMLEAGLEYVKQVDPLQYKRNLTILNKGEDLGDENKYNLEKIGGQILKGGIASVTNDEAVLGNIEKLNQETDISHPEIATAKGWDIIGAYNHKKDNQANNGWWRTKPTIGQLKKWLEEPELLEMFAGNEVSLELIKKQISELPEGADNFKIDDVPVGGFVNNFGKAIGGGFESIGNIFRSDVKRQQSNLNPTTGRGSLTGNYRDPGESPALLQDLYNLESKEKDGTLTEDEGKKLAALRKSTKVRDGWDKFADGTGNITGQVVFQALGTKGIGLGTGGAAKILSLSKAAKTNVDASIAVALNSYDQARQQGLYNFPDDKLKQNIYTGTMVLANSVSERIFKDEKVLNALKKELQGDLVNSIKNLSAKNINRAAVKDLVTEKIVKFAGQTFKEANKESIEEAVVQAVDELSQSTLGAEGYDDQKALERIGNTYGTTLLYSGIVSGLAAKSNMAADNFNRVNIYKMATNPGVFQNELQRQYESGEITEQEKGAKLELLNKATEIAAAEPPKVAALSTKKRAEYLTQNLNIAINEQELLAAKDPNLIAELKSNIEESSKRAKEIYDSKPEVLEEITEPKEEVKGHMAFDTNELSEPEAKAIEGLQGKDFAGSPIKPYTDVIQNPEASIEDKKEALKGLSDQLTAKGTEVVVGTALGKEADLIYDLGYEVAQESEALQKLQSEETKIEEPTVSETEGAGSGVANLEKELNELGQKQLTQGFNKLSEATNPEQTATSIINIEQNKNQGARLSKEQEKQLSEAKAKLKEQGYEIIDYNIVRNGENTIVQSVDYYNNERDVLTEEQANAIESKINTLEKRGEEVNVDDLPSPVSRTIKPLIKKDGKMVQAAEVNTLIFESVEQAKEAIKKSKEVGYKKPNAADKIKAKYKSEGAGSSGVEGKSDVVVDKASNVGGDVETKQQIENFGVNKVDVEPVHSVISQVFSGLKKAGLTAAKTVGDWVSIGKGESNPNSLDGIVEEMQNTLPKVEKKETVREQHESEIPTWVAEFERTKTENDLVKMEELYNKIKVVQNGVLQGRIKDPVVLEKTIKELNDLKKQIEDYAENWKKENQPKVSAVTETDTKKQPINKIEDLQDVGEKIGGAKKDLAQKLSEVTTEDLATKPLSKVFPKPDFKKLVEEGSLSEDGAILLNFLYEKIPTKPRKKYRVANWVDRVDGALQTTRQVLEAESTKNLDFTDKILKAVTLSETLKRDYKLYSDTMKGLGFPKNDINLGEYEIKKFENRSKFNKETGKLEPVKGEVYSIVSGSSIIGDFKTMDDAISGLKTLLNKSKEKTKGTKFDIYQDRKTKEFFIGKKGAIDVVRVMQGFKTLGEARTFLKEKQADLQGLWDAMKAPKERRMANRPRVGADWRKGKNVDSKEFADTFGFRGVEFGNWVNNAERQSHVNEAYDALMDLSSVLGVSPKALSLNGELGFAFGARGSGKANAHYEAGKVVINLTKTRGAGSLAHEWWHAMDNYFSRNRGQKESFITQTPIDRIERDGSRNQGVRKEMIDAFKSVMDAIKGTKLSERSKVLDRARSDAYWSTNIEMSARSFENYIIEKLGERNQQNDYLANFKETAEWINDTKGDIDALKNYPYPLAEESPIVNEKFQQFFETIKEDDNSKLFKDAEAQYRIESGKNIVEAIKDFNGSPRATVALTHEIMHPTVVAIIDGAKEGNEVGAKHTETIVNEFNKANPNNKVTTEDLIKGNDAFKDGTTSKQYRAVQEFIAKSWEKYHREGGKGFSEQFQKVLDQITQAFKSVYKSLTGKQLTPELRKMFDDILGKDQSLSKQESGGKATENETKQEPTKDIKPEQAESQPQPEKTIVEDKQGAGKTKQQEIADKVRALKVNLSKLSGGGLQSNPLGLPVAVWNGAMDIVAKTIEVTGNVADAIQKGIKYIQKNHRGQWDKKGFNDQVLKELGVRGITVNGEDLIVKNDAKTEREYAKTVNGWYSDLEQSVLDVKGEQGRGENWIKVLGKSDEAKWTGLNDWLSQQKGKVSKADIQQYLRDNRIEIVEVVKGAVDYNAKNNNLSYTGSDDFVFLKDNGRNTNYEIRKKKAGFYDVYDNGENIGSRPTLDEAKELAEANFNAENGNPQIDKSASVKFDGYQLAGEKENYKEVLVTMPSATKVEMPKPIETYTGSGKYKLVFDNGNQLSGTYTKEEVADVLKRRSEDKTGMYIDRNEQFKSSHFEEPNILVHLRMNTRVDAEGKKVLFLEEVQSDWGQQGKKSGFANTEQISKLRDEETKLRDSVKKNKGKITADTPDDVYNKIRNENKLLEEQIYAIQTKITDLQSKSTPSAPFVTDTNAWTKLGLKVALKEAVKQGATKIAWTTGEQQNDRYDLSKSVDGLEYQPQRDGKYDVFAHKDDNNIFYEKGIDLKRIEDVFGKDIADKISKNEGTKATYDPNKFHKRLEGDGLKVGGKGMKGFYGSPTEGNLGIVGNVAKSLFKQEPKTVEIETAKNNEYTLGEANYVDGIGVYDGKGDMVAEFDTKAEANKFIASKSNQTQHSIDITPELKAEVEGGLPLFKDIKGRGKEIADLLRKGKIKLGGLQSNIAGLPIAVYNGAIEVIARALEGGATLTQAINRAYQKLKIKEKHKNFNQDEFIKKLEEATGEKFEDSEGAGKEPPIEPPKKEGVGGENKETAGITHAANEVRRQDRALPEYQKEPQSFEQWNNEAEKAIKDGYDVEALMDRLEKGELGRDMPIEVENAIRKIYVATLDAEIAKNPTDALLAKQKRFIEIGDVVNSQLGRGLVSLKGEGSPLSSISDFYVAAMEAKNTDKLTDAEKAEVQKDYADVVAARQKAEKAEKEATAKYEEMKAENELLKQQLAAKNKAKSEKVYTNGKRDFKAEIKNYKDELIKAKEEHLKWMKDNGIQTSSIGGNKIVLNQKMAKIILKIAAVHVEQIGVKIAEVTKKTWEDVKDIFDGITEKDIWDVFNGVYNEKKLTRDNIVAQMRELKTEAKLLSEYENLLKKGEPKPEVEKQKRNQRLTDLRNKIDALKKEQGVGKYSDEAIAKRAIDANKRKMEDFSRRLREGEFEKEKQPTSIYEDIQFKKKNPKLYNELLDSQTKAHDAQLKFEKKLVEEEMKKWGLGDKLRNWAKKFSGTLKTLFASFDASAIAIQNLPFIAINPGIGVKGVARSYRGFLKQKAFDRYLQEIHSSPDWPMIRESIRITEPKSLLESGREEFFPDRFKAVVTIKGKQYGWIKVGDGKYELMDISKPFERQFTMLGNILRITKFRIEAEKLYQKGFTWEKNPEEFKTLGKRINNLTSSSDIPQAFQNEVTRTFIWSSRLIAAKLNMLGLSDVASMIPGLGVKKGYYRGLGVKGQIISRQQAYAAADLAKFATSVVIASYLYALARGGTLNTDPDDTGFLDVEYEAKDGSKKSMNFSGGFSRVISLIFQMASGGKRKDGVFRKYGGWSDPVKEAGRFVSGKAPPLTRTTLNIAAGKDMGGKEADIATEASNYKMPLAFGQIYKQIERDGLGALFTEGLLMYIGVNSKDSRDYDKKDNTISITDPETFKKRNVTPEEQKKYEETKEKGYNTLISDYERGKQTIWVDVNDDINIPNEDNFDKGKPKNLTVEEFDTWKEIKYSKLTPEQKKQLEGKAKRRSSAEAKKELFGVDEEE